MNMIILFTESQIILAKKYNLFEKKAFFQNALKFLTLLLEKQSVK